MRWYVYYPFGWQTQLVAFLFVFSHAAWTVSNSSVEPTDSESYAYAWDVYECVETDIIDVNCHVCFCSSGRTWHQRTWWTRSWSVCSTCPSQHSRSVPQSTTQYMLSEGRFGFDYLFQIPDPQCIRTRIICLKVFFLSCHFQSATSATCSNSPYNSLQLSLTNCCNMKKIGQYLNRWMPVGILVWTSPSIRAWSLEGTWVGQSGGRAVRLGDLVVIISRWCG